MNKRIPVSIALAIIIIAMTVTFSITWIVSMHTFDNTMSAVTRLQSQYTKLAEIDNYVRNNFYGDIDDNYLFDRVAVGYMNGLRDRNSVYYSETEYSDLQSIERGELVGIGVELVRMDNGFRIERVYAESPAEKAGLTAGMRIIAVNGEDVSTVATVAAMQRKLMDGDGTEAVLRCITLLAEEQDFTVRRSNYQPPTVESQIVDNYAYVRINSFTEATHADVAYAVGQAERAEASGIVFDLRGNSTGLFRSAYDIIDMLCPVGTIAKSINKTGTVRVLRTSDESAVELPLVVLVDGGTAGAAELFAISVRELAGGQVVGLRTAGRGTIQSTPYRLLDGSAVSVTTAKILTGRDEEFDSVGIVPDVEVEVDDKFTDNLEGYLFTPRPGEDRQINRAFEVLRAMVVERGGDPGPAPGTQTVVSETSSMPESLPESEAEGGEGGDSSVVEVGEDSSASVDEGASSASE